MYKIHRLLNDLGNEKLPAVVADRDEAMFNMLIVKDSGLLLPESEMLILEEYIHSNANSDGVIDADKDKGSQQWFYDIYNTIDLYRVVYGDSVKVESKELYRTVSEYVDRLTIDSDYPEFLCISYAAKYLDLDIDKTLVRNYIYKYFDTVEVWNLLDIANLAILTKLYDINCRDLELSSLISAINSYNDWLYDIGSLYDVATIVSFFNIHDESIVSRIQNKVDEYDQIYRLKDGTYCAIPNLSYSMLATYAAVYITQNIDCNADVNKEIIKKEVDRIVETEEYTTFDVEELYYFVNLFSCFYNRPNEKIIEYIKLLTSDNETVRSVREVFCLKEMAEMFDVFFNLKQMKLEDLNPDSYVGYYLTEKLINDDISVDKNIMDKEIEADHNPLNIVCLLLYVDVLEKNNILYDSKKIINELKKFECKDGYVFEQGSSFCSMYSTMIGVELKNHLENNKPITIY